MFVTDELAEVVQRSWGWEGWGRDGWWSGWIKPGIMSVKG